MGTLHEVSILSSPSRSCQLATADLFRRASGRHRPRARSLRHSILAEADGHPAQSGAVIHQRRSARGHILKIAGQAVESSRPLCGSPQLAKHSIHLSIRQRRSLITSTP
jgi:hypothetical protein